MAEVDAAAEDGGALLACAALTRAAFRGSLGLVRRRRAECELRGTARLLAAGSDEVRDDDGCAALGDTVNMAGSR